MAVHAAPTMRSVPATIGEASAARASASGISGSERTLETTRRRLRTASYPTSWRMVASSLLGAIAGAVVAFGGTEPASFAAVEILLFVLAACALWIEPHPGPRVWIGPALLAAYLACEVAVVRPAAYPARVQLLFVAACLCAFALVACAARVPEARRSFWQGLAALGLAEALYGLVQYATDWQQVLAFKKVSYFAQATGTYINPNNYAGLLEMLLPLIFARTLLEFERWTANARGTGRRSALWLREDAGARFAFFIFSSLLLTAALLFSRSRTGIVAAWAGLLMVGAIWSVRRRLLSAGLAIILGLAMLTLAAGAWMGLGPVFARYRTAEQDLPSRVAVWKGTAKLIRAHPYWGSGPGSFEDAYTRVQTSDLAARLNHAHNDYLEFAAEWGVPGALLLFALIGFVWVRALAGLRRSARATDWFLLLGCCGALFSLLLHAAVDFNLHIPANALLFASLAGLAWTLSAGDAATPRRSGARR
jgi:O-antigen ligase